MDGENTSVATVPRKMPVWNETEFLLLQTWKYALQNDVLQAEMLSTGLFDKDARRKPSVSIIYLNLVNVAPSSARTGSRAPDPSKALLGY